ncbi:MAG: hypothetical protein ACR2JE_15665 [Acidobacteriaceae bacterium]
MIIRALRALILFALVSSFSSFSSFAQSPRSIPQEAGVFPFSASALVEALPDAPDAQVKPSSQVTPDAPAKPNPKVKPSGGLLHVADWIAHSKGYPLETRKWTSVLNPGQEIHPLSASDKLYYAGRLQLSPVIFVPALFSSGYAQLADADPHYGSDGNGFGERFGAAMLRQASDRLTGNGVFPALFRQDPRYYRVAQGSIVHRGVYSALQVLVRRGDSGHEQGNWSGLLGHAFGNALILTYYPQVSAKGSVVATGMATSLAGDAGSKLIDEFLPDIYHLAFQRKH